MIINERVSLATSISEAGLLEAGVEGARDSYTGVEESTTVVARVSDTSVVSGPVSEAGRRHRGGRVLETRHGVARILEARVAITRVEINGANA
ncbi:hypothetical protein [Mycobacterium kansasii]|uniref:hypothetical protein n=1 Tax=Mycobacterium kansasii TaxID=1768 RepID=UPI0011596BA2|nr:hypothetical protein [Mycobacterium kansasii]